MVEREQGRVWRGCRTYGETILLIRYCPRYHIAFAAAQTGDTIGIRMRCQNRVKFSVIIYAETQFGILHRLAERIDHAHHVECYGRVVLRHVDFRVALAY